MEHWTPPKDGPVFDGCSSAKCVRQSYGKKERWQYIIEESCSYGQNGNNTCSFKRHEKVEESAR